MELLQQMFNLRQQSGESTFQFTSSSGRSGKKIQTVEAKQHMMQPLLELAFQRLACSLDPAKSQLFLARFTNKEYNYKSLQDMVEEIMSLAMDSMSQSDSEDGEATQAYGVMSESRRAFYSRRRDRSIARKSTDTMMIHRGG